MNGGKFKKSAEQNLVGVGREGAVPCDTGNTEVPDELPGFIYAVCRAAKPPCGCGMEEAVTRRASGKAGIILRPAQPAD